MVTPQSQISSLNASVASLLPQFTVGTEKQRQKQQEDLAQLAAVLQLLEEEIADAQSGESIPEGVTSEDSDQPKEANQAKLPGQVLKVGHAKKAAHKGKVAAQPSINIKNSENGQSSPSIPPLVLAMEEMVSLLQDLQVKIVQFGQDKASCDAEIAQAQVQLAQFNLQTTLDAIKKMEAEQAKQKAWGIFAKVVECVVGVVMAVLAVVLVQPELLFMAALSFASAAGLMNYATEGLASVLQDMGCSSEVANIIAAVVVTAIVIVASVAAAPATAAEQTAQAAEEIGTEMTEMGANAGTNAAVNAGADAAEQAGSQFTQIVKTVMSKLGSFLKYINLFNRLSVGANMTIMATTQALTQTNLVSDIAAAIASAKGASSEEQQNIENYVSIAMQIVSTVVSLGSSAAIIEGAQTVANGVEGASKATGLLAKLSQNIRQMIGSTAQLVLACEIARQAGNVGETGAGIYSGALSVIQGEIEQNIGSLNADMILIQTAMNMSSEGTTEDQQHESDVIKQQTQNNKSLSNLADGYAGLTQAIIAASQV